MVANSGNPLLEVIGTKVQFTGKWVHNSITRQDFAGADLSLRRSMASFGTMRPKLIAKVIVAAVMTSAIVALRSSSVVPEPSAICTRPLAVLKRKTPGIIDTTEAKPIAANGMCQWRATGVRITPTMRQATRAAVPTLN